MLERTLEPEVMDSREEALGYDSMDHSEVNHAFVADFLNSLPEAIGVSDGDNRSVHVLDVGTGTALIPIELCGRNACYRVTAIDMAHHMLALGQQNIASAGLQSRIALQSVDAKHTPFAVQSFDAVMSNSIVHHIPEPSAVLREMVRVLRPGGLLFVRDLLRPDDVETVDQLVSQYAGDATGHQRQMFRDSLCAALTLAEIRHTIGELGLPPNSVSRTTDRHWTICWQA